MSFRYQCIHWYKFKNDEVEHILSCKINVTVLCYVLEYIYTVQIAKIHCRMFGRILQV